MLLNKKPQEKQICLLVLLMHRSNIRRLIQGTEPKFHFGKRPGKE